jgi:hypothetical protein
MARLDATWYHFWQRGQVWYNFDSGSGITTAESSFTADAVKRSTPSSGFTSNAVLGLTGTGSFTADAVLTSSLTETGSFQADAWLYSGTTGSTFTADAIIFLGTVSGGGGGNSGGTLPQATIVIAYDGVDITADVEIATAEFTSMVNGNTGMCQLRVVDDGHTYSFSSGHSITLDIDGKRVWGGYLLQVKRGYPFYVEKTSTPSTAHRWWNLVGVDYNFLFERRIVYSAAHPTTKTDWSFPAGTWDDTIINTIFDSYLPGIASDGLSRANVQRVSVAIFDISGVTSGVDSSGHRNTGGSVASAGFKWRDMMDEVSRSTGGVYYIDPDKVLNYGDVDIASTPYVLTDTPSLPVDVGFRKMTILQNGSDLVNDYRLWGAALGSNHIVYNHTEDAASVLLHGLWQAGNFNSALYSPAAVNFAARTVVYGTPTNKRGHKDDAVSFTCTVFAPVFRAGMRVHAISNIWGFDDVIPIRMMVTRFINPHQAVFELTLSHAIDEPWSTFQTVWPKVPSPQLPPTPTPKPPPTPAPCTPARFDDFNRVVLDGTWGTTPGGKVWTAAGSADLIDVDSAVGRIITYGGSSKTGTTTITTGLSTTQDVYITVRVKSHPPVFGTEDDFTMVAFQLGGAYFGWLKATTIDDSNAFFLNGLYWPSGDTFWNSLGDGFAIFAVEINAGVARLKAWDENGAEPDWMVTTSDLGSIGSEGATFESSATDDQVLEVDYIDLIYTGNLCTCTVQTFDDFNRAVYDGWGTSTTGAVWTAVEGSASVHDWGTFGQVGELDAYYIGGDYWANGYMTVDYPFSSGECVNATVRFALTGDYIPTEWAFTFAGVTFGWQDLGDGGYRTGISSGAGEAWSYNTGGSVYSGPGAVNPFAILEVSICDGVAHMRVWTEADPTQVFDLVTPATVDYTGTPGAILVRTSTYNAELFVDYINICSVVPLDQIPLEGYVCEDARTDDYITYRATRSYVAGTTEVWVNGLRQNRGSNGYLETGGQRTITFDHALLAHDLVRICYQANGVL